MAVRHVREHLGQKLQPDQHGMQRVVVQVARPRPEVVEYLVLDGDMTLDQCPRQGVLVGEMVEEAALGDLGRRHDLLDRGGIETLLQDRVLGNVENAGPRVRALAGCPGHVRAFLRKLLYRR